MAAGFDAKRWPRTCATDSTSMMKWAEKEFGDAQLGDKRLVGRLVKIAEGKGAKPGLSCAKTVESNWADTMGFYRFVEHPDEEAVNMESILDPHRQRTIRRMNSCKTVLCIQDTTDLDYSANRSCKGLGVIGKNQTATESRGLRLHSTFATDAAGLPLGILRGACYAPALKFRTCPPRSCSRSSKSKRYAATQKKGLKPPENLGETVAPIGRLGGHLGRRGDPPPGHLALCDGYRTLLILCDGLLLAPLREAARQ